MLDEICELLLLYKSVNIKKNKIIKQIHSFRIRVLLGIHNFYEALTFKNKLFLSSIISYKVVKILNPLSSMLNCVVIIWETFNVPFHI